LFHLEEHRDRTEFGLCRNKRDIHPLNSSTAMEVIMTENGDEKDVRVVRSDLAEPSRPEGYHGVEQPIMPEPPEQPDRVMRDEELSPAVKGALESDGRIDMSHVLIVVDEGVVTLKGTIGLEFQRTLAEALAQEVRGVLLVQNQIEVIPA
jgi:Predicted periplasmic or secreted lipoprotein|tara:strand:+ start:299 stop:748 length:450 start_codon:yes stop_codon:yes gene_type:complete